METKQLWKQDNGLLAGLIYPLPLMNLAFTVDRGADAPVFFGNEPISWLGWWLFLNHAKGKCGGFASR